MRASIAKNYAEENMNFFLPRLHNVLGGEGITGLEFPFVNYSVAILYKLFGFNEAYFRGFVCFTILLGMYFFLKLSFNILQNLLAAILVVALAFFSPVLVYYSTNFMPDVTSLGLVLIGWYLFFEYLKSYQVSKIYWLFFVFTLATLIKITSFIAFGVLFCLLILDLLKFFNNGETKKTIINHKKHFIILSIAGISLVVSWYYYAQWLSDKYYSNAFTLGSVYPKTMKQFYEVIDVIKMNWLGEYYNPVFFLPLILMFLCIVILFKYCNRLLFTITIFNILGSLAFSFLMFIQFKNHDYYIIPLLPSIFFLLLTFFDLINTLSIKAFKSLKFVMMFVFCYLLYNNAIYSKEHYNYRQSDYYLEVMGDDFRMYYDLESKLRAWGIKKDDITLIGYDYTYSNSLYLSNQRGYIFNTYDSGYIKGLMEKKPRILILNDTIKFNAAYPNNFSNKVVGRHKNLIIYKLY